MSTYYGMLQAMGVEQWLPRQSSASPEAVVSPLMRNILFYVNTYLIAAKGEQAQDFKKSLDNITQYVETLELRTIIDHPEHKQRVLHDLRNFIL